VASKAKVPLGKLMNFNDRLDLVLLTGLPTWWWWCWWLAQAPGAPGDVSAFIIGMTTTDPQRKWLRSIFAQMNSNFVVCVSHPQKKFSQQPVLLFHGRHDDMTNPNFEIPHFSLIIIGALNFFSAKPKNLWRQKMFNLNLKKNKNFSFFNFCSSSKWNDRK
jgi:hypothetical protein